MLVYTTVQNGLMWFRKIVQGVNTKGGDSTRVG